MKKNVFVIDFVAGEIKGSKSALKKAGNPKSDEYKELTAKMAAHPTFTVAEKESNENKNTYKGMNFQMMRNFISVQPNADELMAEFDRAMEIADGKYPLVKKWFLDTFKDDADKFKVSKAKKAISDEKIKRVKTSVKRVPNNQAAPANA